MIDDIHDNDHSHTMPKWHLSILEGQRSFISFNRLNATFDIYLSPVQTLELLQQLWKKPCWFAKSACHIGINNITSDNLYSVWDG
jgi:hypothetical protein